METIKNFAIALGDFVATGILRLLWEVCENGDRHK
jgi:hypothetical protein